MFDGFIEMKGHLGYKYIVLGRDMPVLLYR
jgi:hypothetical protein